MLKKYNSKIRKINLNKNKEKFFILFSFKYDSNIVLTLGVQIPSPEFVIPILPKIIKKKVRKLTKKFL